MYIGKRDAAETIGNVSRAANTQNLDVSIVVVDRKIAKYIPRVDTPKRSCDVCGGRASQRNCAIAARNGHRALNGSCGNAAETIAYLESAFYVRHMHGTVVVAHGAISAGPSDLDAARSIVPPASASV